jgi:hypothetical protein
MTDTLDIHGILVRELRADPDLAALVGHQIFARTLPENIRVPACRIDVPAQEPASYPAPAWYTYLGQVDCYAGTHQKALKVSQAVQRALFGLEGRSVAGASFQSVDAFSVSSGVDEDWVPPKPLWSVSFEITGRLR